MLSRLCVGYLSPPEADTHKCLTQVRPASLVASMAHHVEESVGSTPAIEKTVTDTSGKSKPVPVTEKPEGKSKTVTVTIGKSKLNSKCVPPPEKGTTCSPDAGDTGKRINTDYESATDSFLISSKDGFICASRQDHDGGWGMNLMLRCGVQKATEQFLLRSQLTNKCLSVQKINSQRLASVAPCSEASKWTLKQEPFTSDNVVINPHGRGGPETAGTYHWVVFYLETEFDGDRLCLDQTSWTAHETPWGTMQMKACEDLIKGIKKMKKTSTLICNHKQQNENLLEVADLDECDFTKDIALLWEWKGLASSHKMHLGLTNWTCQECYVWDPKVILWKLE